MSGGALRLLQARCGLRLVPAAWRSATGLPNSDSLVGINTAHARFPHLSRVSVANWAEANSGGSPASYRAKPGARAAIAGGRRRAAAGGPCHWAHVTAAAFALAPVLPVRAVVRIRQKRAAAPKRLGQAAGGWHSPPWPFSARCHSGLLPTTALAAAAAFSDRGQVAVRAGRNGPWRVGCWPNTGRATKWAPTNPIGRILLTYGCRMSLPDAYPNS